MSARFHPKWLYEALKASTRKLVRGAGGQESAASITRLDGPRLSRCGNPSEAMYLPIDVVADLESDCGDPMVTKVLAQATGHLLVPAPKAGKGENWVERLGTLSKETGEIVSRICEALADDGEVSAKESREKDLRKEVQDAQEALAGIALALEQVESEGET